MQVVDFAGAVGRLHAAPGQRAAPDAARRRPGTPEYFVSTEQFLNALTVYKFHVDWDKISTSTFTGPDVPLAPTCWPNATPANAPTPANAADVLAIRAMAQAQYSNIGGAESLWVVAHRAARRVRHRELRRDHGGNAAPRWYQVNVTGGTVAANDVQGTTWDPDGANTFFRFMPSLAVDRAGDMAIGYTKSNSTTNPQIKYAGRLAGDPVNTFSQAEQTLIDGTGSQSGNCGPSACIRWGDYSGMALDPNGCEFWETDEYYADDRPEPPDADRLVPLPGLHHGRQRHALGHRHRRREPDRRRDRRARQPDDDDERERQLLVHASRPGTYPTDDRGQGRLRHRHRPRALVVPDGGTLTQNFTLSAVGDRAAASRTTRRATFQRGVPNGCDLAASPGDVQLARTPAIDQHEHDGHEQRLRLQQHGVGRADVHRRRSPGR